MKYPILLFPLSIFSGMVSAQTWVFPVPGWTNDGYCDQDTQLTWTDGGQWEGKTKCLTDCQKKNPKYPSLTRHKSSSSWYSEYAANNWTPFATYFFIFILVLTCFTPSATWLSTFIIVVPSAALSATWLFIVVLEMTSAATGTGCSGPCVPSPSSTSAAPIAYPHVLPALNASRFCEISTSCTAGLIFSVVAVAYYSISGIPSVIPRFLIPTCRRPRCPMFRPIFTITSAATLMPRERGIFRVFFLAIR